jgi:hypothetical protein
MCVGRWSAGGSYHLLDHSEEIVDRKIVEYVHNVVWLFEKVSLPVFTNFRESFLIWAPIQHGGCQPPFYHPRPAVNLSL